jgi:O-antigen/teichoic acid export membrane protein
MAFAIAGLFDVMLAMILLLMFFHRRKQNLFDFRPQLHKMKALLKDSWPLILSGLAAIIYMKIDQIMIGEMLGSYSVGIYSVAVRLSEVWYFIPMVITASVFPSMIEAKKQSEKLYHKRVQQLYTLVIWVAIGIALPMTFLSDWIVQLLYGAEYKAAASVLSIHIWAGVFVFLGVVSGKWLLIENLQIFSTINTVIGAITNVLLNYIFIHELGVFGVAWATLISYFIAAYFSLVFWKKTRKNFLNISKSFFFVRIFNVEKNS